MGHYLKLTQINTFPLISMRFFISRCRAGRENIWAAAVTFLHLDFIQSFMQIPCFSFKPSKLNTMSRIKHYSNFIGTTYKFYCNFKELFLAGSERGIQHTVRKKNILNLPSALSFVCLVFLGWFVFFFFDCFLVAFN